MSILDHAARKRGSAIETTDPLHRDMRKPAQFDMTSCLGIQQSTSPTPRRTPSFAPRRSTPSSDPAHANNPRALFPSPPEPPSVGPVPGTPLPAPRVSLRNRAD